MSHVDLEQLKSSYARLLLPTGVLLFTELSFLFPQKWLHLRKNFKEGRSLVSMWGGDSLLGLSAEHREM